MQENLPLPNSKFPFPLRNSALLSRVCRITVAGSPQIRPASTQRLRAPAAGRPWNSNALREQHGGIADHEPIPDLTVEAEPLTSRELRSIHRRRLARRPNDEPSPSLLGRQSALDEGQASEERQAARPDGNLCCVENHPCLPAKTGARRLVDDVFLHFVAISAQLSRVFGVLFMATAKAKGKEGLDP
ncbi:hypothetical protein JHW43_005487 [Diplocarpon mali]|nr:hypothetical protein JHW43_005487 [Diplocarpon mali]